MPDIYLASYRPLAVTGRGRSAARMHELPLFIDGSCRREPDLMSVYPSISALCRGSNFAPRLRRGDEVIYITVKSSFGTRDPRHWKFVAHLRILEEFNTHQEASNWYIGKRITIPSNCIITGNQSEPYEKTCGFGGEIARSKSDAEILKLWDGTYRKRAQKHGKFLICQKIVANLINPLRLFEEDFFAVFDKIPGTQNPPKITADKRDALLARASLRGA